MKRLLFIPLILLLYTSVEAISLTAIKPRFGGDGSDGALTTSDNVMYADADATNTVKNYTAVTVNAGHLVGRSNTGSIIWYVQGDVTIDGAVSVDGFGHNPDGYPGGVKIDTPSPSNQIWLSAESTSTDIGGLIGGFGGSGGKGGSVIHSDAGAGGGAGAAGSAFGGGCGGGGGGGADSSGAHAGGGGGAATANAGGAAGAGDTDGGAGGAGAGFPGGAVYIFAGGDVTIGAAGIITADGTAGSAGGNGGAANDGSPGGGGGGSGGGVICIIYKGTYTNGGSVAAAAGAGGAAGGGSNGNWGYADVGKASAAGQVFTHKFTSY